MGKTVIAIVRETVLDQLNQSINIWVSGGGRERTDIALKTKRQSQLLEKAPKTTGHLWWKRETTETERRHWMESEWADGEWFGDGAAHRFWYNREMAELDERFVELKRLRDAVNKAPDYAMVYIDAKDWAFAHRSF